VIFSTSLLAALERTKQVRRASEHVQRAADLDSGGHGDQQTYVARPNAFFAPTSFALNPGMAVAE